MERSERIVVECPLMPRDSGLWLTALLLVAVCAAARLNFPDPDTFWHLAVGERILAERKVPTTDVYSFTAPGKTWLATEWLGEIVMAQAARWGGPQGATSLLWILATAFFFLLYELARIRSGRAAASFLACIAMLPLAASLMTLRPQLIGHSFLIVLLIALERFRQGSMRALLLLPVIFLIWVNTHGSFFLGLCVLGGYGIAGIFPAFRLGGVTSLPWTADQRRRLFVVLALCVVVLPLTPYGARLATYPLEVAFLQPVNVATVSEWQPMNFGFAWGRLFLAMLLLILIAEIALRPDHRLEQFGLLIFAVFAACLHRRFALFFVIVFAPYLASLLARWIPLWPKESRVWLNVAALLAAITTLVALFPSRQAIDHAIAERYPAGAVQHLRDHPLGVPLLNTYTWGGYLIWALDGRQKVFVDGRADLYEYAGALEDYHDIRQLRSTAPALLEQYGVGACLFDRESALVTHLVAAGWKPVYHDDMSVLLVRPSSR